MSRVAPGLKIVKAMTLKTKMPSRATMRCSSLNRDPQRRPRPQPGQEREATRQSIDNTPPHPEYPCAHCIESGAAAAVIESVLGSTDIPEISMTGSTAPRCHAPLGARTTLMGSCPT
jgi:hypothetical protein